jgi:hypothetical protein
MIFLSPLFYSFSCFYGCSFVRKLPVPEFIDLVFTKTSPKRSLSVIENGTFWACFRENWAYKFGHCFWILYNARKKKCQKQVARFVSDCRNEHPANEAFTSGSGLYSAAEGEKRNAGKSPPPLPPDPRLLLLW